MCFTLLNFKFVVPRCFVRNFKYTYTELTTDVILGLYYFVIVKLSKPASLILKLTSRHCFAPANFNPFRDIFFKGNEIFSVLQR